MIPILTDWMRTNANWFVAAASLARAIVCSIRTRLKSFVAKVATFSMKRATTISMPITMWFQSVIAIRM